MTIVERQKGEEKHYLCSCCGKEYYRMELRGAKMLVPPHVIGIGPGFSYCEGSDAAATVELKSVDPTQPFRGTNIRHRDNL